MELLLMESLLFYSWVHLELKTKKKHRKKDRRLSKSFHLLNRHCRFPKNVVTLMITVSFQLILKKNICLQPRRKQLISLKWQKQLESLIFYNSYNLYLYYSNLSTFFLHLINALSISIHPINKTAGFLKILLASLSSIGNESYPKLDTPDGDALPITYGCLMEGK